MKTGLDAVAYMTTILALAALNVAAVPEETTMGHDPLMRRIMSEQLTQSNGGLTGAVRIGSGESITLTGEHPTVIDPPPPLKPASGLAVKPAKARPRQKSPRRADEQLKALSTAERRADWSGRK